MKLCHEVETLFGIANRAMGDVPVPSVRYMMPQGVIIFDELISDDRNCCTIGGRHNTGLTLVRHERILSVDWRG